MKKRNLRYFAAVFLAGCSLCASPQDANVVIKLAEDEVPKVFAIGEISRVSFADGMVAVVGKQGITAGEYGVSDVYRIIFDHEGDYGVVPAVEPADSQVKIGPNPTVGDVFVEGLASGDCEISVFSLSGAEVLRLDGIQGNRVPLGSLQRGTYILKIGNNKFKVIKL